MNIRTMQVAVALILAVPALAAAQAYRNGAGPVNQPAGPRLQLQGSFNWSESAEVEFKELYSAGLNRLDAQLLLTAESLAGRPGPAARGALAGLKRDLDALWLAHNFRASYADLAVANLQERLADAMYASQQAVESSAEDRVKQVSKRLAAALEKADETGSPAVAVSRQKAAPSSYELDLSKGLRKAAVEYRKALNGLTAAGLTEDEAADLLKVEAKLNSRLARVTEDDTLAMNSVYFHGYERLKEADPRTRRRLEKVLDRVVTARDRAYGRLQGSGASRGAETRRLKKGFEAFYKAVRLPTRGDFGESHIDLSGLDPLARSDQPAAIRDLLRHAGRPQRVYRYQAGASEAYVVADADLDKHHEVTLLRADGTIIGSPYAGNGARVSWIPAKRYHFAEYVGANQPRHLRRR